MWHKKGKTIKKNWNRERKHTAVQKWTSYLAVGIVLGGFCAALPLQAEETLPSQTEPPFSLQAAETDGESGSYTQKTGALSDNDVPPDVPDPEQPANRETTDPEQPENQETSDPEQSANQETSDPEQPENQETSDPEQPANQETSDPNEGDIQNPDVSAADTSKIPRITSQPEDVCVEAGDCAYFSVSATGKNLTYQWFVDKGNGKYQKISGANESLYRIMVFDGSMNGYVYKCRVENGKESGAEDNKENNYVSNKENSKETDEDYVDSRAAKLTVCYKIVGGARSVWVKSSGRGLVFQGSGAYSRFSGVNVDESRITAGEYNKGGSQMPYTEITLLRSYLETLAQGEHELEIVWSDGSAKTSFRIEPPAALLPADASGLGRVGADTEGSSRAAGKTSAAGDATALAGMASDREKDKSVATLSENTTKPSSGKAADVLFSAGIFADGTKEEMTVTPGVRRTQRRPLEFEKGSARLTVMPGKADRYAKEICMAVILNSAAGIACGILAYRLDDVERKK